MYYTHSISLIFLTISEVSFSDLNLVINVARHDWVVSQPGAYSQERDIFKNLYDNSITNDASFWSFSGKAMKQSERTTKQIQTGRCSVAKSRTRNCRYYRNGLHRQGAAVITSSLSAWTASGAWRSSIPSWAETPAALSRLCKCMCNPCIATRRKQPLIITA